MNIQIANIALKFTVRIELQQHNKFSCLVELVSGKTVTIEYEKRDRYKRIVGKVLVDPPGEVFCMALDCVKKVDAGLEQIKAGLAWHYKYYQMEQSEEDRGLYSEAELEARIKLLGLWKNEELVAT